MIDERVVRELKGEAIVVLEGPAREVFRASFPVQQKDDIVLIMILKSNIKRDGA